MLVDATIDVGRIEAEPLRLWLDAEGRLQASVPLTTVRWFDALGRALEGPVGPGPWIVQATSADGRTVRRILH